MEDFIKSNGECQSQATGVIYKLTNTLNGKAYVGQTKLNEREIFCIHDFNSKVL